MPDDRGAAIRAKLDRIQSGMTREQVAGILGLPTSERVVIDGVFDSAIHFWDSDAGRGYVTFDHAGLVREKGYARKSIVPTLRRWWEQAFGRPAPF